MNSVRSLLLPQRLTEVVDIGANPIDGEPPYKPMLDAGLCRVTGFEPQTNALDVLNQRKSENERYLPYAVGDGDEHTLKTFHFSGMASLFELNPANMALFDYFTATTNDVIDRIPVQTRRLDSVEEIEELDFLKIDIQGGELAVFQGGKSKLQQAVAIQTEVSFVTLYQDQPSFGDVDVELRSQGFIPHCFAALKHWPIGPCVVNDNPRWAIKQLLEADLVYIRDIAHPDSMSSEQLKHLALIAHHCYESFDLALRCVMLLERREVLDLGSQRRYLELVGRPNLKLWEDWSG